MNNLESIFARYKHVLPKLPVTTVAAVTNLVKDKETRGFITDNSVTDDQNKFVAPVTNKVSDNISATAVTGTKIENVADITITRLLQNKDFESIVTAATGNFNNVVNEPEMASTSHGTFKLPDDLISYYVGFYEERAAIIQFDGKQSRDDAQWQAMNETILEFMRINKIDSFKNQEEYKKSIVYKFMGIMYNLTNFNKS